MSNQAKEVPKQITPKKFSNGECETSEAVSSPIGFKIIDISENNETLETPEDHNGSESSPSGSDECSGDIRNSDDESNGSSIAVSLAGSHGKHQELNIGTSTEKINHELRAAINQAQQVLAMAPTQARQMLPPMQNHKNGIHTNGPIKLESNGLHSGFVANPVKSQPPPLAMQPPTASMGPPPPQVKPSQTPVSQTPAEIKSTITPVKQTIPTTAATSSKPPSSQMPSTTPGKPPSSSTAKAEPKNPPGVTDFHRQSSTASANAAKYKFKVVKVPTVEPFRRGRWKCMDSHDPTSTATTLQTASAATSSVATMGIGTNVTAATTSKPLENKSMIDTSQQKVDHSSLSSKLINPPNQVAHKTEKSVTDKMTTMIRQGMDLVKTHMIDEMARDVGNLEKLNSTLQQSLARYRAENDFLRSVITDEKVLQKATAIRNGTQPVIVAQTTSPAASVGVQQQHKAPNPPAATQQTSQQPLQQPPPPSSHHQPHHPTL